MAIALRSDRGIRVLAGASGVGFILAICGSNAMTPLLPGYMDTHGLGPAAASVLFATYFIALIIILLISARGPLIRHSRTVLPLALLAAIVGDLLQIVGASVDVLLFPGRFLTGASVGLSTGAAAAIMVAARGERGRAFIASGSLIGAGSGLVAAIAIAVFLPWQLVTVYSIHAAATAVCLIVLLVGLRLAPVCLRMAIIRRWTTASRRSRRTLTPATSTSTTATSTPTPATSTSRAPVVEIPVPIWSARWRGRSVRSRWALCPPRSLPPARAIRSSWPNVSVAHVCWSRWSRVSPAWGCGS